jgi:hypothetical protein
VGLSPANAFTPSALLRVEQPAKVPDAGKYRTRQSFMNERGAAVIPLQRSTVWVELIDG